MEIPGLEQLLDRLPEREAPRRLADRLERELPSEIKRLAKKPALLGNLLTLSAYSPWLADAMLVQPEIVSYLGRAGAVDRMLARDQLEQELGRFAARRPDDDDEQSLLSAFKLREIARIYLRDCLGLATLTETTEELSNLADIILAHALARSHQVLVNKHGAPMTVDDRGRSNDAEFAVVALGKLGSRELNYASDIDLMFLYDGEGSTATSALDNRAFFTKLAELLFKTVGSPGRTAPVFRVDLRLRPYGQDGELVVRRERAVEYYKERAQPWERQMLIRARSAAGSEPLVARFLGDLRTTIFREEPLAEVIASVRDALDKIDTREKSRAGGFNVKLGPGGIREIEFVAQALQLAYGGGDPWIRSSQVLIGLQRLAEKGFISDSDRSTLSEAYTFLRIVEHRLQMAQGAQTHRLPVDRRELETLARRCGIDPKRGVPADLLVAEIEAHTGRVRTIAARVFAAADRPVEPAPVPLGVERSGARDERLGAEASEAKRPLESAAQLLGALASQPGDDVADNVLQARGLLVDVASRLPHPARALRNFEKYLASLGTLERTAIDDVLSGGTERLEQVVRLLGSGAFFSEILTSQPALAAMIPGSLFCGIPRTRAEFYASLSEPVAAESTLATRMAALRRAWYGEMVAVGSHDILGRVALPEINREQTDLAEAALDVAVRVALSEMRGSKAVEPLPYSVLALGRLGHAGMDYGSDLDLLGVFDGDSAKNLDGDDPSSFFGRLTQLTARVLSALTREGYVYRVDFRLRPEGRSGRMASSLARFSEYIDDRASPWELTAYLKVRPVAGDAGFGADARNALIARVFDASERRGSWDELKAELHAVRAGLEREHGRKGRNIKWGRGGMLDVYFVTRFAQLRTRTDYPPERGTRSLVEHLGETGVLLPEDAAALLHGYGFLRSIDHALRLIGDRTETQLPEAPEVRDEVASRCGFGELGEFDAAFASAIDSIRSVYDRVFTPQNRAR